jgi:3-oxoacyl-[acyl-carrier-protein] synthase-3
LWDDTGQTYVLSVDVLPAGANHTACLLQDRLGLPHGALAFDVNLGCSGYPYGLVIANGLIAAGAARRILLLVGDTFSWAVHPEDRVCGPLFGDAVAATLLERDDQDDLLGAELGTDGSGWANLIVPAGQCRYRSREAFASDPTPQLAGVAHPEFVHMDGTEVFSFTLREVPGLVARTLARAGREAGSVDYFLFHQANRFIQDHLVRKLGLPPEKCPVSIDCYGNTSGASPALTACHAIAPVNRSRELVVMFVGFGIGYSWGGVLARLRPATVYPVEEVSAADAPGRVCFPARGS